MSKRKKSVTFFDEEEPAAKKKGGRSEWSPLAWVTFDEKSGEYRVTDEATEFLSSLQGPVAVCSVVGAYRTGKSYLLNRILGASPKDGLKVSGTTASCTKGLWLMRKTLEGPDGCTILVLDTEGLGSMSASETHDVRVFSLALLLSSTFMFNATGAITEATLNNLSLVASLTEHVRLTAHEEATEEDLASIFPRFLYVCRDFTLKMVGEDGEEVDPTTYLNNALRVRGSADSSKSRVRNAINHLFPPEKRQCFTMVRPVTDESKLQNLSDLPDSDLRPEFLQSIDALRKNIVSQTMPPKNDGAPINGRMLASLAKMYVEAINGGAVPAIKDSWSQLSEGECLAAAEEARTAFKSLTDAADTASLSVVQARKLLRDALESALAVYNKRAVGAKANDVRASLAADLETRVEAVISEVKAEAARQMRDRLLVVEKEASRNATVVRDVIDTYEKHLESVRESGGEESAWWPEAFPSFCRAVEALTFRAQKKALELQARADSADLRIAKAEAEATTAKAEALKVEAEARREIESLKHRAEAAERRVEDIQRHVSQQDEAHAKAMQERDEKEAELRAMIESAREEGASTASTEDQSETVAALTQRLTEKDVVVADLTSQLEDAEERSKTLEQEVNDVRATLSEMGAMKTQLDAAVAKAAEAEAARATAVKEAEGLESKFEEESQVIQREAMESVNAIKAVLVRERERAKKQKEAHASAIDTARKGWEERRKALQQQLAHVEEEVKSRDAELKETRRLAEQERSDLRGEIDRQHTVFREMRESQDKNRKEWLAQIRENRDTSGKAMAEVKENLKSAEASRREAETEVATLKARLEAAERRRTTLEGEVKRSRQMLSQSKSSSQEIGRISAELAATIQQRDKAETEARAARTECEKAKKAEAAARRKAESDITRIKMRYEMQISNLESRLLE